MFQNDKERKQREKQGKWKRLLKEGPDGLFRRGWRKVAKTRAGQAVKSLKEKIRTSPYEKEAKRHAKLKMKEEAKKKKSETGTRKTEKKKK